MGFKTNDGSSTVKAGSIVWGSNNRKLPIPNVYFFDTKLHLFPEDPEWTNKDDNPKSDFSLTGIIKEISIRKAPSYNDNDQKTGEKNGVRIAALITGTDGADYRLFTDLVALDEGYYHRNALQFLASFAEIGRKTAEEGNESFRNHIFNISFYRAKKADKNGKFHAQTTFRAPVAYVGTEEKPELHIPRFDPKQFIKAELPPQGIPMKVGKKTVYDNSPIDEWLINQLKWVDYAFGNENTRQDSTDVINELIRLSSPEPESVEAEAPAAAAPVTPVTPPPAAPAAEANQNEAIAEALEDEDEQVDTAGLADDLGGRQAPPQYEAPRV